MHLTSGFSAQPNVRFRLSFNGSWHTRDITHPSEFARHANTAHCSNTRYLFASLDDGLRRIARTLFIVTVEDPAPDRLAAALAAWWPNDQARMIADSLFDFFRRGRDPAWYEQQRKTQNAIPEFIVQGEACLKACSPATAGSA